LLPQVLEGGKPSDGLGPRNFFPSPAQRKMLVVKKRVGFVLGGVPAMGVNWASVQRGEGPHPVGGLSRQ